MKLANLNITFKPEFGNTNHIRIIELIASVNRDYASYKLKTKEARGAQALKKKIQENMTRVQSMIGKMK